MATWIWLLIVLGALVLVAVLLFGGRRAKERRVVQRREQARELRQEAEVRRRRAEEREAVAQEQAEHRPLAAAVLDLRGVEFDVSAVAHLRSFRRSAVGRNVASVCSRAGDTRDRCGQP